MAGLVPAIPNTAVHRKATVRRVDDIDAKFQRAVDAGGTVVMPVPDIFWGDCYGQLRYPFGVLWAMNLAPQRQPTD